MTRSGRAVSSFQGIADALTSDASSNTVTYVLAQRCHPFPGTAPSSGPRRGRSRARRSGRARGDIMKTAGNDGLLSLIRSPNASYSTGRGSPPAARLVGPELLRGRQRDHREAEARADAVDGRADPLVAIEERELLEHAQVRQLQAEQADRQRTRPRRHEHVLDDGIELELRVGRHR